MKVQLPWGKRWDQSQKYALDYCCPACNWRPEPGHTFGEFTVGVDSEGPKSKQANMIGIQIIECPKDLTFFWVHINEEKLLQYKELYPDKFKDLNKTRKSRGEKTEIEKPARSCLAGLVVIA